MLLALGVYDGFQACITRMQHAVCCTTLLLARVLCLILCTVYCCTSRCYPVCAHSGVAGCIHHLSLQLWFCLQVMYSEFLTLVHSGNVRTAGIDDQADKIYFSLNGHSSQQTADSTATSSASAEASTSTVDASSGECTDSLICSCIGYMPLPWVWHVQSQVAI